MSSPLFRYFYSFVVPICGLILYSSVAYAQGLPNTIQGIDLKLSNDNPSPGQTVTVTAASYISDLNSSTITWTVNGSQYQKGIGITSIQVTAPALGKELSVSVTSVTPSGKQYSNNLKVGSGNVDLILETGGYAPPFFLGKVPFVFQNSYKIIAMPHLADSAGVEYDPRTLVYQWTKDAVVIPDQSGYGKQVFSWKDESVPRQRTIIVKVSTRDGHAQAEKVMTLLGGNPYVVFFRDDPLYGPLYNLAVGDRVSLGKSGETSILAVPFSFNKPADNVGSLSFTWLVNSVEQTALRASQSITLRAPAGQAGSSDIGLSIKNASDILQGAQGGFTVTFAEQANAAGTAGSSNFNGI